MKYTFKKCSYNGNGIKQYKDGVYICVKIPSNKKAGLNIYDLDKKLIDSISFDEQYKYGDNYVLFINGLSLVDRFYKLFSDDSFVVDVYAKGFAGNEEFGKGLSEEDLYCKILDDKNPKGWNNDTVLKTPYSDSVFYNCHVRGLTKSDNSIKDENIRGTFFALTKKINYFKDLGITGLVLLPVTERIEKKISKNDNKPNIQSYKQNLNNPLVNYWGFGYSYPYSIKRSYSNSDDTELEFKKLVLNLHTSGIECILTFDLYGKEASEAVDILKYWVTEYHIDGFRIFADENVCKGILKDSFFNDTKLIFNSFYNIENRNLPYKNIAFVSEDFKDKTRKFLKGDEDIVSSYSYYQRENNKNYALIREITDFNGFSLYDLVSYERKHNELNEEDNKDGTDYNYSWNCGAEGSTTKKQVLKLRYNQCVNGMLLTLLCQGTPMITAGDEWLNSNNGNNNPYCQDNETGWVSYNKSKTNREFYKFVKNLIAFRKDHVILHQPFDMKLSDYISCKLPDVSYHSEEAFHIDTNPASRQFSVLYAGDYARQYKKKAEDSILIIYNLHWEDKVFSLPVQDKITKYHLVYSSDGSTGIDFSVNADNREFTSTYMAKGRTITIFQLTKG